MSFLRPEPLMVAASTKTSKLAGAIAWRHRESPRLPVELVAIGPGPVNLAVKAIIRASEWLGSKLWFTTNMEERRLWGSSDTKTVMVLYVLPVPEQHLPSLEPRIKATAIKSSEEYENIRDAAKLVLVFMESNVQEYSGIGAAPVYEIVKAMLNLSQAPSYFVWLHPAKRDSNTDRGKRTVICLRAIALPKQSAE